MAEVIPLEDVQSLFNSQWNISNVAKPQLLIVNNTNQELLVEFRNRGDLVIFRPDSPALEEIPLGNHKYGNRSYNILSEIYTSTNRQKLYDLMGEIRRICHNQRHSMTNFQRILYRNFVERSQEEDNIWHGQISIVLENVSIILDT